MTANCSEVIPCSSPWSGCLPVSLSPPPSSVPQSPHLPLALQLRILALSVPPPSLAHWPARSALLKTLSLVDKQWSALARTMLLAAPIITSPKAARSLVGLLDADRDLGGGPRPGALVEQLWFGSFGSRADDPDRTTYGGLSPWLSVILVRCPNLRRLTVVGTQSVNLKSLAGLARLGRLELLFCSFLQQGGTPPLLPDGTATLARIKHLTLIGYDLLDNFPPPPRAIPYPTGHSPLADPRLTPHEWRNALLSLCPGLQSLTTDQRLYPLPSPSSCSGVLGYIAPPISTAVGLPVLGGMAQLPRDRAGFAAGGLRKMPARVRALFAELSRTGDDTKHGRVPDLPDRGLFEELDEYLDYVVDLVDLASHRLERDRMEDAARLLASAALDAARLPSGQGADQSDTDVPSSSPPWAALPPELSSPESIFSARQTARSQKRTFSSVFFDLSALPLGPVTPGARGRKASSPEKGAKRKKKAKRVHFA